MKNKVALLCLLVLLITPVTQAITNDGMLYGAGLEFGFSSASGLVNSTAPDWTTDYQSKSNAEFALIVLESTYTIDDIGNSSNASMYNAGVTQGIQNYIDMMDSVGEPVWGTGYPGDPTATVKEVPELAHSPIVPATRGRHFSGSTGFEDVP